MKWFFVFSDFSDSVYIRTNAITMNTTTQIAKQVREIFLNGNWICPNMKDQLADVTWQEATTQVYKLNTIAMLTYHLGYYVGGVLQVLQGGTLDIRDKYSYDCPPINSQEEWEAMQARIWDNVETFAQAVEQLSDSQLNEPFVDEKYGNYYRNLLGIVEHTHYHVGQIALVKKVVRGER